MNNNNFEQFLKLLKNNKITKENEIETINNIKKIYNIIRLYEPPQCKYDEIITNYDIRIEFLIHSIEVAFKNQEIDENTRNIILQMYEEIYNYLYKDSELKEIEIEEDVIKNIFNNKIIPTESQIRLVMTLMQENKRIFDLEIKNKYFSQKIDEGLHTGITKELKIEEENLSHLLGLTNDGSLYEFFRKNILNEEILKILSLLGFKSFKDKNFDKEKFNAKFKDRFGLDYTKENLIKIINWRYNAQEDYLQKRGITVTEQERIILNRIYDYAPKSYTLNYYCRPYIIKLLEQENNEIKKFIYEYIRSNIILKSKEKHSVNELKKLFTQEELDLILNQNISDEIIIDLINKYIEQKKYKFEEDKNFKTSFLNKFGYLYPLINYYELLSKNVSFYNFSLFKNLNSIIVDYDPHGKKIESNVFLVSYSQNKFNNIENEIIKLINEKNKKYEESLENNNIDKTLDNNYIMNLKSLSSFKEEDRYYFRFGFISKDNQKQDDQIIIDNSPNQHNITLIGFKPSSNEITRLKELELRKRKKVKHFLNCETNITSNYYQYKTDFTRNGIEYPIDILDERGELPYNIKRKILKIVKPLDKLSKYIQILKNYTSDMNINFVTEIDFLKQISQKIIKIIEDYQRMTSIKIKIMQYRLETRSINEEEIYKYRLNLENEIITSNNIINNLNQYKEYVNEIINYQESKKKIKKK